ncbi:MAG: DUF2922 domain-containing protein [Quinella sp. 1Q5]|nr:DUF2922 domain-containing protein [Quinella sp. 1Q5]
MADIITTKKVLQNVFTFADGDTRTVNIPNPKDNLTAEQVQAWADFAVQNQILIGDKTAAALTGIQSSKILDVTSTDVDIS